MNKYLSDTSVTVEMLRGNQKAKEFLEKSPEISVVTFAELIQGCQNKQDLQVVKKACAALRVIELNTSISITSTELLAKYHFSHGLLYLDSLIAATAIIHSSVLVSDNNKDFKYIEGLETVTHTQAFK